jgi:hypothetical protein
MLRIAVDFNLREGPRTIVLRSLPAGVTVGTKVVLYEPGDIECEAIVRRGDIWDWVADMVEGSIK